MRKGKWGESFLKTGVPLEHLTLMTLNSLGWKCELHREYRRPVVHGEGQSFEIDLIASRLVSKIAELCLVIECKYHDEDRFWFFLPCATPDHVSKLGSSSPDEAPDADSRALSFVPLNPLIGEPSGLLTLAPKSFWGTVISQDGVKQENAVQTALHQLAYATVPIAVEMFDSMFPRAIIPVVVTSAKIFRLRPEVTDLDRIRGAATPSDIADELPWTWCHRPLDLELMRHNHLAIRRRFKKDAVVDEPEHEADSQLFRLLWRPTWIVVVNIAQLVESMQQLSEYFDGLAKNDRLLECMDLARRIWQLDYPTPG